MVFFFFSKYIWIVTYECFNRNWFIDVFQLEGEFKMTSKSISILIFTQKRICLSEGYKWVEPEAFLIPAGYPPVKWDKKNPKREAFLGKISDNFTLKTIPARKLFMKYFERRLDGYFCDIKMHGVWGVTLQDSSKCVSATLS